MGDGDGDVDAAAAADDDDNDDDDYDHDHDDCQWTCWMAQYAIKTIIISERHNKEVHAADGLKTTGDLLGPIELTDVASHLHCLLHHLLNITSDFLTLSH